MPSFACVLIAATFDAYVCKHMYICIDISQTHLSLHALIDIKVAPNKGSAAKSLRSVSKIC